MEGLGRNVGRDETVVGGTWGLDRGFGMEGKSVFFLVLRRRGEFGEGGKI